MYTTINEHTGACPLSNDDVLYANMITHEHTMGLSRVNFYYWFDREYTFIIGFTKTFLLFIEHFFPMHCGKSFKAMILGIYQNVNVVL